MRQQRDAIAASGATLAFDALGGGTLAGQILSAMERACSAGDAGYNRYGSRTRKAVYIYGGLDSRPTQLDRSYGMAWTVGGWLLFDQLDRMDPPVLAAMKARIAAGLGSTFRTSFAAEVSLTDLLRDEHLRRVAARRTGEKLLVNPRLDL